MWTPLSASRWILLLTLGVMMLPSESEAIEHDCCYEEDLMDEKVESEDIGSCLEQTSSSVCGQDAYWIKSKGSGWKCIHPEAKWLQEMITQKIIECRPLFGKAPIFEVLDEDEDEDEEEEE